MYFIYVLQSLSSLLTPYPMFSVIIFIYFIMCIHVYERVMTAISTLSIIT